MSFLKCRNCGCVEPLDGDPDGATVQGICSGCVRSAEKTEKRLNEKLDIYVFMDSNGYKTESSRRE